MGWGTPEMKDTMKSPATSTTWGHVLDQTLPADNITG